MSLKIPKKVPELGFYYHYKHDPKGAPNNYAYEVLGIGFHTETDEVFLNYRPLYDAAVYQASQQLKFPCVDSRPLEMWMEDVTKDGKTFPRFQKITDPDVIDALKQVRRLMYGD